MGPPRVRLPAKAATGPLLLLSLSFALSCSLTSGQRSQARPADPTYRPLTSSLQVTSSSLVTSSSSHVTSSGQADHTASPHDRVLKEVKVPQGSIPSDWSEESVESEKSEERVEIDAVSALGSKGVEGTVWISPTVDEATLDLGSVLNIRSNSNSGSDVYTLTNSKPNPAIALRSNSNGIPHNDVLYKPKKGYPSMAFNGKYQKLRTGFDFAWWCNNTWRCYENPDRSVQLSTFWTDKVSGENLC